jgi:hypothetical protein
MTIHNNHNDSPYEGKGFTSALAQSHIGQLQLLEILKRLKPNWFFRNIEDHQPFVKKDGFNLRIQDIGCTSPKIGQIFIEFKDFPTLNQWEATGYAKTYWQKLLKHCSDPKRSIVIFKDREDMFYKRAEIYHKTIEEIVKVTRFSSMVDGRPVGGYYGSSLYNLLLNTRCRDLEDFVLCTARNGIGEPQYIFAKKGMLSLADLLDAIDNEQVFKFHVEPEPEYVYKTGELFSGNETKLCESIERLTNQLLC